MIIPLLAGDPAKPAPEVERVTYTPPAFPLHVASQIVVDGNSISAGHIAIPTLADTLKEYFGGRANGTLISSGAVNGETWQKLLANINTPGDVVSRWDTRRDFHAVIANETTNSIRLGASVEQTKQDAEAYFEFLADTYPSAVVVAWPALPAGHADAATYPLEPGYNAGIVEVNEWMRTHLAALSIDVWVDVRSGHPQFDHDGSLPERFTAFADGWQESPPSRNMWGKFGWLHPTVGEFPSGGGKGRGKRAIAAALGDVFLSGLVPSMPQRFPRMVFPFR
ncbi:hypothetical protein ACUIAC_01105 [Dermabacteraceae bacterium P13138]